MSKSDVVFYPDEPVTVVVTGGFFSRHYKEGKVSGVSADGRKVLVKLDSGELVDVYGHDVYRRRPNP